MKKTNNKNLSKVLSGSLARIRGIVHDYKKSQSQASTSTSKASTSNDKNVVGGAFKLEKVSSTFEGSLKQRCIKITRHIDPKYFLQDINKLVVKKN